MTLTDIVKKLFSKPITKIVLAASTILPFYSCQSTRNSDYVEAGAAAAQFAENITPAGRAIAKGIEILADNAGENQRVPVVNVNTSSQSQPQSEAPYDWKNILLDPRIKGEPAYFKDHVAFSLSYKGNGDIYIGKINEDQTLTNIRKLTRTPTADDINPKFIWGGENIEYYSQHKCSGKNGCKMINSLWEENKKICITHKSYQFPFGYGRVVISVEDIINSKTN